jgi:hypothetical protein
MSDETVTLDVELIVAGLEFFERETALRVSRGRGDYSALRI